MTLILRGKNTRFYAYLIYALAVISLVGSAVNGGIGEMLWALPIASVLVALGWTVFHNPRLEVDPEGLRVVNVFREHLIPWSDLAMVENRWGIYVHTKASGRKVSVWAIPSTVGLFNNSWRAQKSGTQPADPNIEWKDSGTQSRTVTSGFAADLITLRHQNITSNANLPGLKPAQHCESEVRIQVLPILVLGLALTSAILTLYNWR
ncbi:PH domain-containing protein [Trueperella pyogenes]|uniref:PH domain-containing protein n=1 Tax=Trueperella pyogenes TaxID=1661 RepID=UPI003250DE73